MNKKEAAMNTWMKLGVFVLSFVCLTSPLTAQESDYDKLRNMCIACHGVTGTSPFSSIPNLQWQNSQYLEAQLFNFKSGQRQDITMTKVAKLLNNEDISKLAQYFNQASTKEQ